MVTMNSAMRKDPSLKSKVESFYLDRLLEAFFAGRQMRVSRPDPPDAVIERSGEPTIGVEFRYANWGQKKTTGGDGWQYVRSLLERLENDFAQACVSRASTSISCDVRLLTPDLPSKKVWLPFIDELVDICIRARQMEQKVELRSAALEGYTVLPQYLESIVVYPRLRAGETEIEMLRRSGAIEIINLTETFGFLRDIDVLDGLEEAVREKAAKLARYRTLVKANEFWLVLHGGTVPSNWPPQPEHLSRAAAPLGAMFAASGFSRILYDGGHGHPISLFQR